MSDRISMSTHAINQLMTGLAEWTRDGMSGKHLVLAKALQNGVTASATKIKALGTGTVSSLLGAGVRVGMGAFPVDPYLVSLNDEYGIFYQDSGGSAYPLLDVYVTQMVRSRTGSVRVVFASDAPYLHATSGVVRDVQRVRDVEQQVVVSERACRIFRLRVQSPPGTRTVTILARKEICMMMELDGVVVRAPHNYDVFGMCVPADLVERVVLYTTQYSPFFAGWIELDRPGMSLGALSRLPDLLNMTPHITVNAPDALPDVDVHPCRGAVTRTVAWHGNAKYLLQFTSPWFAMGPLTLQHPVEDLRLLVAPRAEIDQFQFVVASANDFVCAHTMDNGTYVGDTTELVPDGTLFPEDKDIIEERVGTARDGLSRVSGRLSKL